MVLEGLDELNDRLKRARARAPGVVSSEIRTSSGNIVVGARQRVRRRTGRLAKSIKFQMASDGLSSRIGPKAPHGHLVERGTRHSRAFPYLFPAFEEERPKFQRRLSQRLSANLFRR